MPFQTQEVMPLSSNTWLDKGAKTPRWQGGPFHHPWKPHEQLVSPSSPLGSPLHWLSSPVLPSYSLWAPILAESEMSPPCLWRPARARPRPAPETCWRQRQHQPGLGLAAPGADRVSPAPPCHFSRPFPTSAHSQGQTALSLLTRDSTTHNSKRGQGRGR